MRLLTKYICSNACFVTRVALLVVLCLTRCDRPSPEAARLLEKAEQLMVTDPDSALLLIHSLYYSKEKRSREQSMHYIVLRREPVMKIDWGSR